MLINRSITARLALLVLLGAGCVLSAIIGYNYIAVRRMLMADLEAKAHYLAFATVNRIETTGRAVEKVVQGMAIDLEMNSLSTNGMDQLLRRTLEQNSVVIYGAAIALNPFLNGNTTNYCAPYVFRENGKLASKDLAAGNYRYDLWDWFNLPRKLKKPVWCEPYFDEGGGNILMVTYSCPIFKSNEFYGVVTSDVSLEWLSGWLASLLKEQVGYAWLISANGTFITHPRRELIMNETLFSTSEVNPDPVVRAAGREIGRRMIHGETGFVPFTSVVSGKKSWLFFAPVPSTDWSLGVMFFREELMRQVFTLNRVNIILGVTGFAFILIVAIGIARSITKPLRQLAGATRLLARGDLDKPLPMVRGEDEVAQLAGAFEHMRGDLQKYIIKLQETTAAKERIESEMRIARAIQMDLVPKTFPERKEFNIFGLLEPAREVGGDFYDFFMPDERHIFLFIGDVSGKGMPAALFMAVTRTLLRAICRVERNPSVILRRLNDGLAEGNDANMFVTLFCALVDLKTGECRYSNGGHNPPFIVHASGEVAQLPLTGGLVMGVIPNTEFDEKKFVFQLDDVIFLYTDGVTEAMNPDGAMFGEGRMIGELQHGKSFAGAQLVKSMREALLSFAAGAEQSDDITMLVFRFCRKL